MWEWWTQGDNQEEVNRDERTSKRIWGEDQRGREKVLRREEKLAK